MIISINPTVFESTDIDMLSKLSEIFKIATTSRHLVDIESFANYIFDSGGNYVFNDSSLAMDYLSAYNKSEIESFFDDVEHKSAYLTDVHRKYLTTITVGIDAGEFNPIAAHRILNEVSRVILENGKNDWKFIKGIVEKYSNHKKRKSIYKLIDNAISNFWIEPENAGGKGQIKIRFMELSTNRYKDIQKFKLAAIFDSDKDYNEIKTEQKNLIEFFKGKKIKEFEVPIFEESDVIVWHMLYKREVENYIPLGVIFDNIDLTDTQKVELRTKTSVVEQYDFFDFDDYLKHTKTIDVKNDFPDLFLKSWTKDLLEQRCEHHKVKIELPNGTLEDVTEMEQILLKIAKII